MDQSVPSNVILPPVDVRETIDKTAGYVHRNGPSFEVRLRDKESANNKFNFIQANDAYNNYYKWRLQQLKSGEITSADISKTSSPSVANIDKASTQEKPKPEEFDFLFDLPPISSLDLEIIKLTALFVAKNGQNYINHIKAHKNDSGQFDFLDLNHSLHSVFQKFVNQCKITLNLTSNDKILSRIDAGAKNPYEILSKAYNRAEYLAREELDKQKELEQKEKETLEYASIDWQDFVVVETIIFTDADNVTELPLPLSLSELQYRSLEQKKATMMIEEAPPDFDEAEETAKISSLQSHSQQLPSESNKLPPKPVSDSYVPKGMKVKAAGESRRKAKQQPTTERMIQCPLTGRQIPESKFSEHIKILLRDPRYEKEKESFEKRNLTYSNLTTDEVYQNIKQLVGSGTRNVESLKNKVQWDGYSSSIDLTKKRAAEEVTPEVLEKIKKTKNEKENRIGPL